MAKQLPLLQAMVLMLVALTLVLNTTAGFAQAHAINSIMDQWVETLVKKAAVQGGKQFTSFMEGTVAKNALHIGADVLQHAPAKVPVRIVLGLNQPTALGNHEILLPYMGLGLYSETQLYFVVAHELAHIHLKHAQDRFKLSTTYCGSYTESPFKNNDKLLECVLKTIGHNAHYQKEVKKLNRQQEYEADLWAVNFLLTHGLPLDYKGIFEKIHVHKGSEDSTHPDSASRMEKINQFLKDRNL